MFVIPVYLPGARDDRPVFRCRCRLCPGAAYPPAGPAPIRVPTTGRGTARFRLPGRAGRAWPRCRVMSPPLAAITFAVAAALSLGASAVLVVRLERLGKIGRASCRER